MTRARPSLLLAALAAAALVAGPVVARAGASTAGVARAARSAALPGATAHRSAPGSVEVVATGLNHPRGIVAGPFGTLLVAESGEAGSSPCLPPSPGTANKEACASTTGAVTAVWPGGKARVAEGLASNGAPDGTAASGPHDLLVTSRGLEVLFGYANNPGLRAGLGEAGAPLGQLAVIDAHGDQHLSGDLAGYEGAVNPDGRPGFPGQWSNPYSTVTDGADRLVSDSGGNDILRVKPDGTVSTVAVFPTRDVPAPPTGALVTMEAVPTGMVRGPDGALYVGELTGFPSPPGSARVWRVVPGQAPTVYATGFTNIIDVAFDAQGRLLVLEVFANGLLSGNPAGALKRVGADGTTTPLLTTGLVTPTSMAVASSGAVYIANKATAVGTGEVIKFTPPA